jgi:hypothetical protein
MLINIVESIDLVIFIKKSAKVKKMWKLLDLLRNFVEFLFSFSIIEFFNC